MPATAIYGLPVPLIYTRLPSVIIDWYSFKTTIILYLLANSFAILILLLKIYGTLLLIKRDNFNAWGVKIARPRNLPNNGTSRTLIPSSTTKIEPLYYVLCKFKQQILSFVFMIIT
ncbi:MAG: hypothetical protein OHM56_04705 [Spiroplasma phoeniceum]|nr:MAG: hypothetical protein OHM56_04705 [Spiroplasma phoeniceum]